MTTPKHIGYLSATALVMANMIGTGVFTSLGFQAANIHSGFALLLLWVIGGIVALTGALCYGELGATLLRSGGEYNFLSRIYHPAVGFLSGWVSATVGFAAPIAAAAIALGNYVVRIFPDLSATYIALAVVFALTGLHLIHLRMSGVVQTILTFVNVGVMITIILFGLFSTQTGDASFLPSANALGEIVSPDFVVALFFVSFAYSGWNAATYIAGEIDNPHKNLPRSLLTGTLLVTFLYVMLNFIFLYTVPLGEMRDASGTPVIDIGTLSAMKIFGEDGGKIIAIVISLLLFSSISSMIIAGPRVMQIIGEDFPMFRALAKKNRREIPLIAIVMQTLIAVIFVATATFSAVITYIGFTLSLFTFLSVLGVFVLRIKQPNLPRPYKTWGYPVTPIIFLIMGAWILAYGLMYRPWESLSGLATVVLGLVVYYFVRPRYN